MTRTPSRRHWPYAALLALNACGGVDPTSDERPLDLGGEETALGIRPLDPGGQGPSFHAHPMDLGGDETASQIERDFGGPDGLMNFFQSHTEEEIRQALLPYGVGYHVHGNDNPELISECPKFFPSTDWSVWHNFDGEFYYVDGAGRPNRAYKDLPPISAAPRLESCQASIGQWGDAENPKNDYDGGHLIGSQLGGWGGRANIVPQDANFNRGNWVQLENKMALCGKLPSGRLRYHISVDYPNATALIPTTMTMVITNQSTGAQVSLAFQNVDYGGQNGTSLRQQGVTWLSNQGCN